MTDPVVLDATAARPFYGRVTWAVVQRVFHAEAFLLLRRPPADARPELRTNPARTAGL